MFVTRTWSFRVADTTAPVIAGAVITDPKTIRVTWSKAIELVNPEGANDGLNSALYALEANPPDNITPFVNPTIASVAIVSAGNPSVIDLTLASEITPSVPYFLTETGVEDAFGNETTSVIALAAFVIPSPAGRVFDLYRALPLINRQEDTTQDLLKFIRCLQEVANLLLFDVDSWCEVFDVDVADEPFLDAMLEDLGNPFPFVLTVLEKRKLIRLLVAIYQEKGTAIGIVNACRFFLGLTVTIATYDATTMSLGVSELGVDWILGPGNSFALYAFTVNSAVSLTADQISQITFIANYMKPAHTHLISVLTPVTPPVYDPIELGLSELGVDWILHDGGFEQTTTVTSVSPNTLNKLYGGSVVVIGFGFTGAYTAILDGVDVPFVFVSDTEVVAEAPPHAVGSVAISIVSPTGEGTLANALTYVTVPVQTIGGGWAIGDGTIVG